MDMDSPENTFVNHCGKFVIFLVHILCLFSFVACLTSREETFEKLRGFLLRNCIEINLFAVFFLEPRLQTRTDVLVLFWCFWKPYCL